MNLINDGIAMTRLYKGLYDRLILDDELAEINQLIQEGRATVQTPSFC